MHHNEHNGILADKAAGLSHQLQNHLSRMARVLEPHVTTLNRRFVRKLKELKYEPKQRESLEAITPGYGQNTWYNNNDNDHNVSIQ